MATGGRLRESDVPDIYLCAVCMEHLLDRNPRYLSCHHSFCQQCLQQLINNGQLSCPICRAVTAVPNNDITKLTMNFQLVQMMEREKELREKEEKQLQFSGRRCNFCSQENVISKCRECNQFLCESCETKHKEILMFNNHTISKLCQKHLDGISHICMKCIQAVCAKCIVLDHADHVDKVNEYHIGVDHLKLRLKQTKKKLKEKQNVIEKCQNEITSKKTDAIKERMKLQKRRDALVKEIEQIDHELVVVSETKRKYDEDVKLCSELKEKYDACFRNVDKLLQSHQYQIVSNFVNQSMLAEKILNETEKLTKGLNSDLNEEIHWLEKPVLENHFGNLGNFQIKLATSIKYIDFDTLVYSDLHTNRFVVFDNKGTVKRSFEGLKEHGHVRCVDVYKNQLYLAQGKQIMCVSNFCTVQETSFTFMPKMNSLFKMAVANDNILICTDIDEGKVYEYNTKYDTTKMVLEGLEGPSYISVNHTPQGTIYILSLGAVYPGKRSVNIYNEDWQLLTTITQCIQSPLDTAPCPGGFLLADGGCNKITLYSFTGELVRTVLTKDDGLDHPTSLALKPPHLWVGQDTFGSSDERITCFRVL